MELVTCISAQAAQVLVYLTYVPAWPQPILFAMSATHSSFLYHQVIIDLRAEKSTFMAELPKSHRARDMDSIWAPG